MVATIKSSPVVKMSNERQVKMKRTYLNMMWKSSTSMRAVMMKRKLLHRITELWPSTLPRSFKTGEHHRRENLRFTVHVVEVDFDEENGVSG